MSNKTTPVNQDNNITEAVCVHTSKIFDSCRDKDCMEDLHFFPTSDSVPSVNGAVSVRARGAQLLYTGINVDEITFNRGFYTVDIRYYYKVSADALTPTGGSEKITGLCLYDKRVILFGSEGSARVFTSDGCQPTAQLLEQSDLPRVVVEAVDPIVLNMRLVDSTSAIEGETPVTEVPDFIADVFDSPIVFSAGQKIVYATLGQFSLVRMERQAQLLVPVYDYCMPEKECTATTDDDPCALFSKISFPVDEFFPPDSIVNSDNYRDAKANLNGKVGTI